MSKKTMVKRFPAAFKIYKSNGAAQFVPLPIKWKDERGDGKAERVEKEGCVLLDVAESNGEKSYDWDNKINFAFLLSDICQIFDNPDAPKRLVHKTPNSALMKGLEFKPGTGKYVGTYMMQVSEKNEDTGQSRNVTVPLSGGEYTVLLRLFMAAAPILLGWQERTDYYEIPSKDE